MDEKRKDELFLRLRVRYVQLLDTLDELSDVFGLQLFAWLSLMFFHTCVKVFLYAKYKVTHHINSGKTNQASEINLPSVLDKVDRRKTIRRLKPLIS